MNVQTDGYGYEILVRIFDDAGTEVYSVTDFGDDYLFEGQVNLQDGCYTFRVDDGYGDGILNGGYVSLTDPDGNELFNFDGGSFGSEEEENFGVLTIEAPAAIFTLEDTGAGTIVLENQSTGGGLSYSWDFGDGNTSDETSPTYTYAEDGTYTVCLTVTNSSGSSTECEEITISLVSVEAFESRPLNLFPNPAEDMIQLNMNLADLNNLQVFNTKGQEMQVRINTSRIDISNLSSGIYVLVLTDRDNVQRQLRFTKL